MGSHTFPLIIKQKWLDKYPDADYDVKYDGISETSLRYDETIKSIRKKRMPNQAILHIGVEFTQGGHYGIAIKNGEKVIVFDSMQMGGRSVYSSAFLQVAEDVFDIEPVILQNPADETVCPQPTGGFVFVKKEDVDYIEKIQDLDSQNHFCYLWAIFYFHVFISMGDNSLDEIFEILYKKCIPSLAVIKRYIWSILHSLYPTDELFTSLIKEVISFSHGEEISDNDTDFFLKFFLLNFRYIWDDMGTKKFNLYSIIDCDLKKFREMSNINQCLEYSVSEFNYVLDKFT